MDIAVHNKLVSFIWSIADDCLRDIYVRGKYRDVILPMLVLRRLDALLEPTKEAVLEELAFQKKELGLKEWDPVGLRDVSGYVFYNTSKWTLKRLYNTAANSTQILKSNFREYLNGFSENVIEINDKFKLKGHLDHLADKNVLLDVVEKFISPDINLTPKEIKDPEGRKLPGLSNVPYGKSWSTEQKYIKENKEVIDKRFEVNLKNYWEEEEVLTGSFFF